MDTRRKNYCENRQFSEGYLDEEKKILPKEKTRAGVIASYSCSLWKFPFLYCAGLINLCQGGAAIVFTESNRKALIG